MKQSLLPEWAPVDAVLLAWPYPTGAWCDNYQQVVRCYWDMLAAISSAAPIWLLYHSELDAEVMISGLGKRNIARDRVVLIRDIPYDDTWIRDYGPLSLSRGYLSYTFNGWGGKYAALNDNRVAERLAEYLQPAPQKLPFVCEGGALETNGRQLLANADCLVDEHRNARLSEPEVEAKLLSDLGLERVIWLHGAALTGDDTDGHIDTIVRFTDASGLVYAGRSEHHPDAQVLARLHQQVQAIAASYVWQTFELPSPTYRSVLDDRILPCTYANFLIVNGKVFAPIYGLPEDEQALVILRQAFADYTIVPVRCEALLEQHGSLHCATMQIANINAL